MNARKRLAGVGSTAAASPPAAAPSRLTRGQHLGKGLAAAVSGQAFFPAAADTGGCREGRDWGRRAGREVDAGEKGGSVGMTKSSFGRRNLGRW
jgi:hypothetical protein